MEFTNFLISNQVTLFNLDRKFQGELIELYKIKQLISCLTINYCEELKIASDKRFRFDGRPQN